MFYLIESHVCHFALCYFHLMYLCMFFYLKLFLKHDFSGVNNIRIIWKLRIQLPVPWNSHWMHKKSKDHSNCSPGHPYLFPKQSYCSPQVETPPALHISSGWVAVPCLSFLIALSGSMHTCTFVYSSLPDRQPRSGFWKTAQLHTIHTSWHSASGG